MGLFNPGVSGSFNGGTVSGATTFNGAVTFGNPAISLPANTVFTGASSATNTVGINHTSNVADGASSVAHAFDNTNAFTSAGAKLMSIRDGGTENMSIQHFSSNGRGVRLFGEGSSSFVQLSNFGGTELIYGSDGFASHVNVTAPEIIVGAASVWNWTSGDFTPSATNTRSIGTSSNLVKQAWLQQRLSKSQSIAAAASITIDPTAGEEISINLSATAITSLTVSTGQAGQALQIYVKQDGTGSRTIPTTWTNVTFPAGSYTATTTANAVDYIILAWDSGSSKWRANVVKALS